MPPNRNASSFATASRPKQAANTRSKAWPQGNYTLEFSRPDDETEYVTQYYNGKVVPAQSERIALGPGSEVHADATLELGGSVSGVVSAGPGPTPIAGVVACAWFTAAEETARCSETDSSGVYSLKGLPAGQYKISFGDFFGRLNIAPQFYSGRASYREADEVTVTANRTTLNVNATVAQGAEIKGAVVDAESGQPVWGYEACAFYPDGEEAGCSETDDNGAYTISGLLGGAYLVRFESSGFSIAGERYSLWHPVLQPRSRRKLGRSGRRTGRRGDIRNQRFAENVCATSGRRTAGRGGHAGRGQHPG